MNNKKSIEFLNNLLYKYENRFPKIKGIGNISRSDIEECILRLQHPNNNYMTPCGTVKQLLEKL